jgi:hypothetical protein
MFFLLSGSSLDYHLTAPGVEKYEQGADACIGQKGFHFENFHKLYRQLKTINHEDLTGNFIRGSGIFPYWLACLRSAAL